MHRITVVWALAGPLIFQSDAVNRDMTRGQWIMDEDIHDRKSGFGEGRIVSRTSCPRKAAHRKAGHDAPGVSEQELDSARRLGKRIAGLVKKLKAR